jgi:hypothetical protein
VLTEEAIIGPRHLVHPLVNLLRIRREFPGGGPVECVVRATGGWRVGE